MVHLSVQKAGAGDGADFDFALNPIGTISGGAALRQPVAQGKTQFRQVKVLGLLAIGVNVANKKGFPKEKPH
jgi:hypothetical protein